MSNCNLKISPGSVHVLVGANGSGKSSLAATIMGSLLYKKISGQLLFHDQNLCVMSTHIRARKGIYFAMQDSVEISGLQVLSFLKEIVRLHDDRLQSISDFLCLLRPLLERVGLPESILYRYVNIGFSGGEKKRFELLQMLLLKPKFIILDEIDSGVDIEGLKMIASTIMWYKQQHPDSAFLIITHHHKRMLNYMLLDKVHVMIQGRIVHSGSGEVLDTIEQHGYGIYEKRAQ